VVEIAQRISVVDVFELRSTDSANVFFGNQVVTIGPAYHGWVDSHVHARSNECHKEIVSLSPEQIPKLSNLRQTNPQGWRDAGLDKEVDAAFGAMIAGEVVSVAAYKIDFLGAASFRVITHTDHRRRGFASSTLSACVGHAVANGPPRVYQTLLSNTGAVELARSVGFADYGRHIAVRPPQP
jgi:GNAT superfamily N-acetyltransferase